MKELTAITQKTHPELFQPGIIFTNAPYRTAFYRIDKMADPDPKWAWHTNRNQPMMNVLSKGGIRFLQTANLDLKDTDAVIAEQDAGLHDTDWQRKVD